MVSLPAESTIDTEVPSKTVGRTPKIGPGYPAARFSPLAETNEPGATAWTLGLAAERTNGEFSIVEGAVGARATPRSTSPAAALFATVNCSLAAPDAVVLARTSLIITSLFGSAP